MIKSEWTQHASNELRRVDTLMRRGVSISYEMVYRARRGGKERVLGVRRPGERAWRWVDPRWGEA